MLVIGRYKHTYQEIEDMIHSLFSDVCEDEFGLLTHKLKKIGFAYYNSNYREDAWDSHTFIDFTLFDSMFCCPIYVAKYVFYNIVGGSEFGISTKNKLQDEGIILSYLKEHLHPKSIVSTSVYKSEKIAPYAIKVQLLFCKFDEQHFVFNENGSWQSPVAEDEQLRNRISRLIQIPFHNNAKRKKYKKYIQNK